MNRSIDGVVISRSRYPPARTSTPRAVPPRPQPHKLKQQLTKTRKRALPQAIRLLAVSLAAMAIGFGSQVYVVGELALVCYGLAAFIWRIPSRTTFSLAFIAMATMTILLVVRGNVVYAQAFASYTFLLLVVGVLTLSRELKKEGGRLYSSRKPTTNE